MSASVTFDQDLSRGATGDTEARRAHAALMADIGKALEGLGRNPADTTWRPCPACGADRPSAKPVLRAKVYDFHSCEGCSLVYTPRVLHDDLVRRRYRNTVLGRAHQQMLRAATETVDPESYALILDRVLDFAPSRGAAIDVGSGYGALTAALKPRFDESLGLELDPRTADIAARRHQIAVRSTRLEDLGRPDGSVDAITFQDVLEELPSIDGVLAAAHRLLRPGGVIYVGVTNGTSVGMGLLGARHPAVATHLQLNLFSAPSLEELARRAGFAVRSITTNDELDVSAADWALARLPDAFGLGTVFDRIARAATQRWHLASRRGRGSTLEMVATKASS